MVDTVDTLVQLNGKRRYQVRFTNVSDGTGEAAVSKVVKANLTNLAGAIPGKLSIERIEWSIGGFSSVRLFWAHTTPDEITILGPGVGFMTFDPMISDPGSAGGTGDITFTTAGAAANATYSITLWVVLGN